MNDMESSQQALSLTKVNPENSLRWIGEKYIGLIPQELPIASRSYEALSKETDFSVYRFGKYNVKNAIVLNNETNVFYLFVNPYYKRYRNFFLKVVNQIKSELDVDHVLSRNLAKKLGYNYVLLSAIPQKVNRKHGVYEVNIKHFSQSDVCYADERIFNKILGRNPLARLKKEDIKEGYSSSAKPKYGLTLKQKGQWNSAFHLHQIQNTELKSKLKKINKITKR